jgi:hypothetical protein
MPPLVSKLCEYGVPTVPLGRLVVMIDKDTGMTMTLRFSVAVCGVLSESFTSTVKLAVPALLGVPEIAPVAASVRPAGRLPALRLHV